jgi:hypothetical protein
LKFNNYFVRIAAQKNKHSGETPPTFLQKNEFLEIPKIHFCPVRDNMLVEKQGQKYICPARDNMSIQP